MMSKRSIRAKFEDVRIINGVAVFFSDRNKKIMKLANNLRSIGYTSAYVMRSVGIKHGKSPIAMTVRDARRFFDDYDFDEKFTRPDFEKAEKFYTSINYNALITSIYDPNASTKSSRTRAYLFWIQDIIPTGIGLKVNVTKSTIYLDGLEKYVNVNQTTRPYAFIVETYPKHSPPKVFTYEHSTLEDGRTVRVHTGLAKKFGSEFGFIKTLDEIDEMPSIERDVYLNLARLIS